MKRNEKIIGVGRDPDLVCPCDLSIHITTRGGNYVASASESPDAKAPWTGEGLTEEQAIYRCVQMAGAHSPDR